MSGVRNGCGSSVILSCEDFSHSFLCAVSEYYYELCYFNVKISLECVVMIYLKFVYSKHALNLKMK